LAYTELGLLIYSNNGRSVTKINKGSITAFLQADALPPVSNVSYSAFNCQSFTVYTAGSESSGGMVCIIQTKYSYTHTSRRCGKCEERICSANSHLRWVGRDRYKSSSPLAWSV